MDNERLIELVYERNELWDVGNRNYHNRDFSRKLWNEIANAMDCTSHLAKSKWQNLRDTYRKEYMKHIRIPAHKNKGPHWKYFHKLSFLNDVLALRKKFVTPIGSRGSRTPTKAKVEKKKPIVDEERETSDMDDDIYTDINPLRYLCEVPQVVADETQDKSSAQDTISDDAFSATENQDNNNNGRRRTRASVKMLKQEGNSIVPPSPLILQQNEQNESHQQPPFYEEFHHFAFNLNPEQHNMGLYDDFEATRTENNQTNSSMYDEDYHFLISLLTHLRDIPKNRKLHVRQKLQQVLLDEQNNILDGKTVDIRPENKEPERLEDQPNINSEESMEIKDKTDE
ncbi:uncharacterized protein LOC142325622 [Lycorma delicatula]|uniref:uncharacterized protein LOC142325622 n=1 Tax=Lycorma delicatula TaxID=130591 RepID=UPI003F514C81